MTDWLAIILTICAVLSFAWLILEILASRYPDREDDEHSYTDDIRG